MVPEAMIGAGKRETIRNRASAPHRSHRLRAWAAPSARAPLAKGAAYTERFPGQKPSVCGIIMVNNPGTHPRDLGFGGGSYAFFLQFGVAVGCAAQNTYREAYNRALTAYFGNATRKHIADRIAWQAVKSKYEKVGGEWVLHRTQTSHTETSH